MASCPKESELGACTPFTLGKAGKQIQKIAIVCIGLRPKYIEVLAPVLWRARMVAAQQAKTQGTVSYQGHPMIVGILAVLRDRAVPEKRAGNLQDRDRKVFQFPKIGDRDVAGSYLPDQSFLDERAGGTHDGFQRKPAARPVEIENIQVIGLEAAKALLNIDADQLRLFGHELGGQLHLIPGLYDGGKQLFTESVPIRWGGVEMADAGLQGEFQDCAA